MVGLDPNPEMLAVARAKPSATEWRDARAEAQAALRPFVDASGAVAFSMPALLIRYRKEELRP